MAERQRLVYMAQIAERTKRYEDMVDPMKQIALMDVEFTVEEANLIAIAYHNVIAGKRDWWKILDRTEVEERSKDRSPYVHFFPVIRRRVASEISNICEEFLNLIKGHVIRQSCGDAKSLVFYHKLICDCYRYLAQIAYLGVARDSAAARFKRAYKVAHSIAATELSPTDPIRLGLELNNAVFEYDIYGNKDNCYKIAKQALDAASASSEIDPLSEESHADIKEVVRLLKHMVVCTHDGDEELQLKSPQRAPGGEWGIDLTDEEIQSPQSTPGGRRGIDEEIQLKSPKSAPGGGWGIDLPLADLPEIYYREFERFQAGSRSGLIESQGMARFENYMCRGLRDPNWAMMILSWTMKARRKGYISKDEWGRAFRSLVVGSLSKKPLREGEGLMKHLRNKFHVLLENISSDRDILLKHDFFSYVYSYELGDNEPPMDIATACKMIGGLSVSVDPIHMWTELIKFLKRSGHHLSRYDWTNLTTFFLKVRHVESPRRPRREPLLSKHLRDTYACAMSSENDWSALMREFYGWLIQSLVTTIELYEGGQ